jgi:hypothetical protein
MIMKSLAKARIELLEPEAKAGDGDALIQLGIHYYWGKGVERVGSRIVALMLNSGKSRAMRRFLRQRGKWWS